MTKTIIHKNTGNEYPLKPKKEQFCLSEKIVSLIEAKVFMDWKGQNEFIDWLKKTAGEKLC